jgi:hypothetical protein
MKHIVTCFCLICVSIFIISGNLNAKEDLPVLKGPYLGQKPPGMKPEVFATGIVSTKKYSEDSITFSPKGDVIYFTRASNDPVMAKIMVSRKTGIMVSRKTGERWTYPVVAPFSGQHIDFESHVSPDGNILFFNRFNPNDKAIEDGIWMMRKTGDGWGKPIFVGKGMYATSTLDGYIYLTDRSRPYEKQGIVRTRLVENRFTAFEWQEGGVNSPGPGRKAGRHSYISPDESFIVFDSYKKGTDNTGRLFVCFRDKDGSWSNAVDLGDEINIAPAICASLSPDGKYLFFGCNGGITNNKNDIYWVDAKIIEDLKPKDLK